jgi:GH35 family endo-1,4-beta-xylanase
MDVEWSGLGLALSPKDLAAWEKAEQEIEANRCGDVIVRVADENGQALSGVPVRYEQRQHAFRFGAQYPYQAEVYDLLQEAGVNSATLWLGWKYVQPEPGLYNWGYLERVWNPAAMRQRGLRLTAHALNWFKPLWNVLPQYLVETPLGELPRLVYDHIEQVAWRWGAYIETFELANEPFWGDADALNLTLEDMVRICKATALAVRDVLPHALLEVNFAEISRVQSYHVRPCDLLAALDQQGVPYDRIGLQAFENGYSVTMPPTFYRSKTFTGMLQSIAKYVSLGRPLDITALAVPSVLPVAKPPSGFKLPYGAWGEETQARYLDAAYTLLFARREIEGITWWCPVDGRLAYIPGGGLLREDLTPKPAYQALRQWVARHTTSGTKQTDDQGRAVIRGYAGDYELTVGSGAMGRRLTHAIHAREVHERMVVLAHNS